MDLFQGIRPHSFTSAPLLGGEGKEFILGDKVDASSNPFNFNYLIDLLISQKGFPGLRINSKRLFKNGKR